jgi:hypothetical protein
VSAAESLDHDRYAIGYLDGLMRRPMADESGPGRRRFTVRDLAEVLDQGRRLGRAEAGGDAELINLVERIASSRPAPGRLEGGPVRHLHLVRATDG